LCRSTRRHLDELEDDVLLLGVIVLGLVTFAAMLAFIRFCEWV
jgi:hypothetical protein